MHLACRTPPKTPTNSKLNSGRLSSSSHFKTPQKSHLRNDPSQLQPIKQPNIIQVLDELDPTHTHKYKLFKNHSKISDVAQIQQIIAEMMEKYNSEGKLTSSEQYILSGYLGKYLDFALKDHTLRHKFMSKEENSQMDRSARKGSPSKRKLIRQKNPASLKLEELKEQLQKLRMIWQFYQIKLQMCSNLNKKADPENKKRKEEMMGVVEKLKALEKAQGSIQEEKKIAELDKVMKKMMVTFKKLMG